MRPEILQQPEAPATPRQPRDARLGVGAVAEHDRFGRARGRARRLRLAVADGPTSVLRGAGGFLDALHAERALLHDAATAHRDVGVELVVERRVPARSEEVE